MSNCAAGDLARIVHPGEHYGKVVDVLYQAPNGSFVLPDGSMAAHRRDVLTWVCRAHGETVLVYVEDGTTKRARYVGIEDIWLRPFRGLAPDQSTVVAEELEKVS